MEVQKKTSSGSWEVISTDASWETRLVLTMISMAIYVLLLYRFRWVRTSVPLGQSRVEIEWDIPRDAAKGTYQIKHFGYRKRATLFGSRILSYSGVSREFQVY